MGQSSRPLDKGGGRSPKKVFSALQFDLKNKRWGRPPGPSPGSATAFVLNFKKTEVTVSSHLM